MSDESEFYMEILEKYSKICDDEDEKLIGVCQKIVELMEILRITNDKQLVKNALIFILSLFDLDHVVEFKSSGDHTSNYISNQEKEKLISILEEEFC